VLRLADSSLRAGRIAGLVEAVQTGCVHAVRDADELVSVLLSTVTLEEESADEGSTRCDSGASS
jgi:hypothetical protein